jgi:hypothetical protein
MHPGESLSHAAGRCASYFRHDRLGNRRLRRRLGDRSFSPAIVSACGSRDVRLARRIGTAGRRIFSDGPSRFYAHHRRRPADSDRPAGGVAHLHEDPQHRPNHSRAKNIRPTGPSRRCSHLCSSRHRLRRSCRNYRRLGARRDRLPPVGAQSVAARWPGAPSAGQFSHCFSRHGRNAFCRADGSGRAVGSRIFRSSYLGFAFRGSFLVGAPNWARWSPCLVVCRLSRSNARGLRRGPLRIHRCLVR